MRHFTDNLFYRSNTDYKVKQEKKEYKKYLKTKKRRA